MLDKSLKEAIRSAVTTGRVGGIAEVIDVLETTEHLTNGIPAEKVREIVNHFNCIVRNYTDNTIDNYFEKRSQKYTEQEEI